MPNWGFAMGCYHFFGLNHTYHSLGALSKRRSAGDLDLWEQGLRQTSQGGFGGLRGPGRLRHQEIQQKATPPKFNSLPPESHDGFVDDRAFFLGALEW